MITTGKSFWVFCQQYRNLSAGSRKLVLSGEALLLLRDCTSDAVRRRLQAFIAHECNLLKVPDKTANFM